MKAAPFRPSATRKVQLRKSAHSVPPASSSQPVYLFLSQTHTHTHAPCQTTSYLRFSVNTAWSLWSFQKERLHHIRALICSSGLYLMRQRCELTPTPAIRMKPAVKTRWRPILLPCTDLQRTARARVAELLKQRQCADVNDAGLINSS